MDSCEKKFQFDNCGRLVPCVKASKAIKYLHITFFLDVVAVSNLNYLIDMFLDTRGALFMPEGLSINVYAF